ncbi:MAG: hypothetical protein IT178_04480, partial [Acidobacteria bacterium]|nr:hypothetical protein [Acidobacteriota bacterium]
MSTPTTTGMAREAAMAVEGDHTLAVKARLVLQLAVAALVVYLFKIEGDGFLRVFLLATVGFVINMALPLAQRLPFFVALSFAGVFAVFGLA